MNALQTGEPVCAYHSPRDQLAQCGGGVRSAGAGLRQDVVEERRAAGFEAGEDGAGAGGERRGGDGTTLGNAVHVRGGDDLVTGNEASPFPGAATLLASKSVCRLGSRGFPLSRE